MSTPFIEADLTPNQIGYYLLKLDETDTPYHWVLDELDLEDTLGQPSMTMKLVVDGVKTSITMTIFNSGSVRAWGHFYVIP